MLSVGGVSAGGGAYYVGGVGDGAEDYYLGADGYDLPPGDLPGRWIGAGAERLGLSGHVGRTEFLQLLNLRHPTEGRVLRKASKRTAFDLCWSAPKSVSVLQMMAELAGEDEIAKAISLAHESAVDSALMWLEAEARELRCGKGGGERIDSYGWIVAVFQHRTSRAGDPQLHSHAVVANSAEGVDGRWRTLNGAIIFKAAKTAGFIYQAELRARLTMALGVEWTQVVQGQADIAGMPKDLLQVFSKRREEVLAEIGPDGDRREAEKATLATRKAKTQEARLQDPEMAKSRAKDYQVPFDLVDGWEHELADAGYRPELLYTMLGEERTPQVITEITEAELTGEHASFTSRDLIRLAASNAPEGALIHELYGACRSTLDRVEAFRLEESEPARETFRGAGGRRVGVDVPETYTTRAQWNVESAMIKTAGRRVNSGSGVVGRLTLAGVMRRYDTLGVDQAEMLRNITRSGNGVDIVVGAAGTGKTFALRAAGEAWAAEGYKVIGCSHQGSAADLLTTEAKLAESYTIDSLFLRMSPDSYAPIRLDPKTIVVVDEAEMAGTKRIAELVKVTNEAGAKLVLVGDPSQLPSIDAGGPLAALAARLPHSKLEEVRRQQQEWEREALTQLRNGDTRSFLEAYADHGRIKVFRTAEERNAAMIADRQADAREGLGTLLMAGMNIDVDELNRLAQAERLAAGELGDPLVRNGANQLHVGDVVLLRENNSQLKVRNGHIVTIAAFQPKLIAGKIAVETEGGVRRYLPRSYLKDSEKASLGYAITGHRSQGKTVDIGRATIDAMTAKESSYVKQSRGRESNWIYVVGNPNLLNGPKGRTMLLDGLERKVGRSIAKEAAVDVGRPAQARPASRSRANRTQGRPLSRPPSRRVEPARPDPAKVRRAAQEAAMADDNARLQPSQEAAIAADIARLRAADEEGIDRSRGIESVGIAALGADSPAAGDRDRPSAVEQRGSLQPERPRPRSSLTPAQEWVERQMVERGYDRGGHPDAARRLLVKEYNEQIQQAAVPTRSHQVQESEQEWVERQMVERGYDRGGHPDAARRLLVKEYNEQIQQAAPSQGREPPTMGL